MCFHGYGMCAACALQVRFMVAQLALALSHMHAKQMLYRDLKPANVLIDEHGHLRVVDMGMATKLDPETGRRKSVCGTQRCVARRECPLRGTP
jgi:serine/threonine protein kinase